MVSVAQGGGRGWIPALASTQHGAQYPATLQERVLVVSDMQSEETQATKLPGISRTLTSKCIRSPGYSASPGPLFRASL